MTDRRVPRRTVLRTGAGGVAAAALSGLAGCGDLFPGGDEGRSAYTEWIAEPGTYTDQEHIGFDYFEPATLSQYDDELGVFYETYEGAAAVPPLREAADVDFDEIDAVTRLTLVTVLEVDYDRGAVADELEADGFVDEADHEDYTIYLADDESFGVGIDGSTLVVGRGAEDLAPEEVVERTVDTANQEEDRYVDEDEAFAEITDAVGSEMLVFGSRYDPVEETRIEQARFEGGVGNAETFQVDGETTDTTEVFLFEDDDDVDEDVVEDYVDEVTAYEDHDRTTISADGRLVEITGSVDTADMFARD